MGAHNVGAVPRMRVGALADWSAQAHPLASLMRTASTGATGVAPGVHEGALTCHEAGWDVGAVPRLHNGVGAHWGARTRPLAAQMGAALTGAARAAMGAHKCTLAQQWGGGWECVPYGLNPSLLLSNPSPSLSSFPSPPETSLVVNLHGPAGCMLLYGEVLVGLVGWNKVMVQGGDFALVAVLAGWVPDTSMRTRGGSMFKVGREVVVGVVEAVEVAK